MAVIGDLPAVGLVAARAVGAEQALVRIAERMAARASERGLGGQASSVCRHARQRLPPLRHVEQRGVIHADDAALSPMLDVAGGERRSEEPTSEIQELMRTPYAVF